MVIMIMIVMMMIQKMKMGFFDLEIGKVELVIFGS